MFHNSDNSKDLTQGEDLIELTTAEVNLDQVLKKQDWVDESA